MRRFDHQRIAFRNRVGQRHVTQSERPQLERIKVIDHVELDFVAIASFFQLFVDQLGGERGGVERHAQFLREIRHRADMILMGVGQDHAQQIGPPLLDEFKVGKNQLGSGIFGRAEAHPQIDHQPLALATIEIDVHANLARSAERAEQQFVAGLHSASARLA